MKVDEVAAALRDFSVSSTYEAIHAGQIRAIRVGRRLRVPTAEVWRLAGLSPDMDEAPPASEATVTTDDRTGPGHDRASHVRAV